MIYELINLELIQDDADRAVLLGWLVTDLTYKQFELKRNGVIKYLQTFAKKDYKNFDTFVGVMGKFNPHQIFYDPIPVRELSFIELLPILQT